MRESAVTVIRVVAILCGFGILLVWIVYPMLMGYLAARRPCRCVKTAPAVVDPPPSVSVIIATRDDAATVRERVADCLRAAHDPDRFEVVVGVDAQSDFALQDISIAPNVRVVNGDQPGGKAPTLNAAVRAARGDLLLFTDSQQRFEAEAVERLVAAFGDESVGAASGRLELSEAAKRSPVGRYWSYERWIRRCEGTFSSCVGATGAIWALRRVWSLPRNRLRAVCRSHRG